VDKQRQAGPHAHWIATSPDNRFALAADLGLDDVLVYKLDYEKGTLTSNTPPYVQVKPGSGPRHFAFHPNGKFGYLLTEMATTVTAFSYDAKKGALTAIQTVPTLPKGYSGPTEAAEIAVHPSGKFLYASNRAGVDTITSFSIDAKGMLKETGQVSTKGKTPRNFAIDPTGAYLLAANEDSGNVVVFKIEAATGVLTPTGEEAKVSAPVSLAFLALEKAASR
jgi:6-phosphogluconolactonase